jgi:hypothetical protein
LPSIRSGVRPSSPAPIPSPLDLEGYFSIEEDRKT